MLRTRIPSTASEQSLARHCDIAASHLNFALTDVNATAKQQRFSVFSVDFEGFVEIR